MALIGISGKIGSGKDTVGYIINALVYLDKHKKAGGKEEHILNDKSWTWKKIVNDKSIPLYGGWEIKKFAYKLKQIVALLTGCTVQDLENADFKNEVLGEEWDIYLGTTPIGPNPNLQPKAYQKITYRDVLQKVGTEAMRNNLHENVWVNGLFADYKGVFRGGGLSDDDLTQDYPNWIITDMRFPNELEAVKKRDGIAIRVNRPKEKVSTGNKIIDLVLNESKDFGKVEHPSETGLDDAKFDYIIDNDGTIEELVEKVKNVLTQAKII